MLRLIASASKMDILGPKFSFYIGQSKLKTLKSVFGGILSLFFILFMITATYVFGKKWIEKSHPTVSVNSFYSKRDHNYNLYSNNTFVAFGMFDGVKFPKTEQTGRYFTIKAQFETTYMQESPISPERRTSIHPIPVVKCEHLNNNHTDFASKAFSIDQGEFYRGSVFCTDRLGDTNWKIRGAPFELPYSMIRIRVYPCSLDNPQDCASPTELAKTLFLIPIYSKSVDFGNFTDPLRVGIDTDLTAQFSLASKTKMTIWFRESSIYDDNADFIKTLDASMTYIEQHKVTTTIGTRDLSFQCSTLQIEDGSCIPYLEILVRASPSSTKVERRYYKLLNLVSEVGGFGQLVFLILALISNLINSYYQTRWVRRQLYQGLIQLSHKKESTNNSKENSQVSEGSVVLERHLMKGGENHLDEDQEAESEHRINTKRDLAQSRGVLSKSRKKWEKGEKISKKNHREGKGEIKRIDSSTQVEEKLDELRVDFDYFELIDSAKKCLICSSIFLKDFHAVLLPFVIFKHQKKKKKGIAEIDQNQNDKKNNRRNNNQRDLFKSNKQQKEKGRLSSRPKENNHNSPKNEVIPSPSNKTQVGKDISVLFAKALFQKLDQIIRSQKVAKGSVLTNKKYSQPRERKSRSCSIALDQNQNISKKELKKFVRWQNSLESDNQLSWGELEQKNILQDSNQALKYGNNQPEVSFLKRFVQNNKKRKVSIGDILLKKRQSGMARKRISVAAKFKSSKKNLQKAINRYKPKRKKYRSHQEFLAKSPKIAKKKKVQGKSVQKFEDTPPKMSLEERKSENYTALRRPAGSTKKLLSEILEQTRSSNEEVELKSL